MTAEATAKQRLLVLTAVRLAGIVVAFVGMVLFATDRLGAPRPGLGTALIVVGLGWTLLAPLGLLRRWRGK